MVPIPGTKSVSRLIENVGAVSIKLSKEEAEEIERSMPEIVGERYEGMRGTFNTRL